MLLEIWEVTKAFNGRPVLRGISFGVAAGEIVVLLGPSGCGKTTLLRIVAGLETADSGQVRLDGRDLSSVPVHRRGFGFVFQDFALFPHKNVGDNVAFGLRMLFHRRGAEGRVGAVHEPSLQTGLDQRVAEVLNLVGLAGFRRRPVHELSGGEQQRVALARSLAPAPRLLLLDEPLGSLDAALRGRLMGELRTILKQAGGAMGRPEGITAIYVTHDQAEAFAIADRVLVMNEGRLEQEGRPVELFQRPRTPFVARFLGMENLWPGRIVATEPLVVRTEWGDWLVEEPAAGREVGDEVLLLARPDAGRLTQGDEAGPNLLEGRLVEVSFRGRYQLISVVITMPAIANPVTVKLELEYKESLPPIGQMVRLWLDPAGLVLL